tara:strand:+ start:45 stop:167 length:123 start_codon:yes stop_codon:yes gene_type:complete
MLDSNNVPPKFDEAARYSCQKVSLKSQPEKFENLKERING